MEDYIICVRNVRAKKFGNEPGSTKFLKVSNNAKDLEPSQRISKNDWIKIVRELSAGEGNETSKRSCGDILVFIHGYNNSKKIVLERHRLLKKTLKKVGYKGVVVSFDWPSDDKALNYLEDRKDAKHTAIKLVDDCIQIFSKMQNADCEINVHLLAHSTGAYVIREAFDDADDRPRVAGANWNVSQIMFVAGDVSVGSMTEFNSKSSSLYRHCTRLTNYSSPYDAALKLSNVKRIGVAPRVGRIGLSKEIPDNAVNVDCGDYYNANESVIESIGTKSHSWYIGDEMVSKDIFLTMTGNVDRHCIETRVMRDKKLYLRKK